MMAKSHAYTHLFYRKSDNRKKLTLACRIQLQKNEMATSSCISGVANSSIECPVWAASGRFMFIAKNGNAEPTLTDAAL